MASTLVDVEGGNNMDELANGLRDRREALLENTRSRRWFLKASALAAGTAAIVPLLAACGGDDDDNGDDTETPAASAPTATTAESGGEATPGDDASPEAGETEEPSTEPTEA